MIPINFYQIQSIEIKFSNDDLNKIKKYINTITVPSLTCSSGEVELNLFSFKYPSNINLSGRIQMNVYETNDFSVYNTLKSVIGKEFNLTITITINEIDISSKKVKNSHTITYNLSNCMILNLPQNSYTNVDEPQNITYDVEILYGKFTMESSITI